MSMERFRKVGDELQQRTDRGAPHTLHVPAISQGFLPNSISTDLHTESMNAGMKDILNVMSKLLNIGIPKAWSQVSCAKQWLQPEATPEYLHFCATWPPPVAGSFTFESASKAAAGDLEYMCVSTRACMCPNAPAFNSGVTGTRNKLKQNSRRRGSSEAGLTSNMTFTALASVCFLCKSRSSDW